MRTAAVFLISFYQRFVSPWKSPSCRFFPSCSEYAKESILKYGFMRGAARSLFRVLRCNPFNKGGFDPVR